MSYCRWSSEDWKCDVYCYESTEGGYQVHVAARRVVGDVPKVDWSSPKAVYETYQKQMKFMDTVKREIIGLQHDGESFSFNTAKETAAWLVHLKYLGYVVPEYAIEALMEEEE